EAALVRVAESQAGFVICFDQDAKYDSPNFLWFRERYERFLYVDRIAVDATTGLKGVGSALYDAVAYWAAQAAYPLICAEVNTDPPNPGSLAFHAKRGFEAAGDAYLEGRGKSVRYLVRRVE
ncbi:MAG: GNAT family N-acetyltransferase, partial [Pseudomonadota bacterium]